MRRALAVLSLLVAGTGCAATAAGSQHPRLTTRPAHHTAATTVAPKPHIFLIVLENESYTDTYVDNPTRYIGSTLEKQGTLLTHYHAIGHFSLDNYIAMISGQAPNIDTSDDCQQYLNLNRSTKPAVINSHGQAVGEGCVYPSNVMTLGNQLSAQHVTWRGYMEDMGNNPKREQKRCGVPTLTKGRYDDTQEATAKDQYAARHNPFAYFHSLIDSGLCKKHVVPLTALPQALAKTSTTPHFSFITPDLCDDGHDAPCAGRDSIGSKAGGLISANHFLKVWVPRIEKSPAFKKNGLIIITSDESELSDDTKCCGEMPGPAEKKPGIQGPGGGRIGSLVIGECVSAGAKDPTPYNHYSLLRSLENIFGIDTGGTDGHGHLGYAAAKGLRPFGRDLFTSCTPT